MWALPIWSLRCPMGVWSITSTCQCTVLYSAVQCCLLYGITFHSAPVDGAFFQNTFVRHSRTCLRMAAGHKHGWTDTSGASGLGDNLLLWWHIHSLSPELSCNQWAIPASLVYIHMKTNILMSLTVTGLLLNIAYLATSALFWQSLMFNPESFVCRSINNRMTRHSRFTQSHFLQEASVSIHPTKQRVSM